MELPSSLQFRACQHLEAPYSWRCFTESLHRLALPPTLAPARFDAGRRGLPSRFVRQPFQAAATLSEGFSTERFRSA